jgi:hypothetical protein
VESVFLGEVGPDRADLGQGPALADTGAHGLPDDDPVFVDFAFGGAVSSAGANQDERERLVRARLMREGFIRVEGAGLFASDRYILPDQVESLSGDKIRLRVRRDDLLKR